MSASLSALPYFLGPPDAQPSSPFWVVTTRRTVLFRNTVTPKIKKVIGPKEVFLATVSSVWSDGFQLLPVHGGGALPCDDIRFGVDSDFRLSIPWIEIGKKQPKRSKPMEPTHVSLRRRLRSGEFRNGSTCATLDSKYNDCCLVTSYRLHNIPIQ